MYPIKSWGDLHRMQINKEDEANHPIPKEWKTMKVYIPKSQKAYKEAGWINFFKSLRP